MEETKVGDLEEMRINDLSLLRNNKTFIEFTFAENC